MTDRREVGAVYVAGLAQGVALVTFPAASSILTSPSYYDLTSTAYGALFVPQAIAAISAALAGARLTRRYGIKRMFFAGLVGDVVAMTLLFTSQFAIGDGPIAYAMLLLATTSLGIGFGLTVPALNTLAAGFFPERADRAVLYLNALLGLGTALAPLLVAVFLGLGAWSALPALVAIVLVVLIITSAGLSLEISSGDRGGAPVAARPGLPPRFWVFAAFAVLYGVVETMNGNWATLYMTTNVEASTAEASLALTTFWAMVTVGRVVFAAIEKRFPETNAYRLLPFVAAFALAVIAFVPTGSTGLGVVAFGLAGLGCSALLPLTISFGQAELAAAGASIAGLLIAAYQVGYGVAAFGVGPLQDTFGVGLAAIYGLTAVIALAMAWLAFVVVRRRPPLAGTTVASIPGSL